MIDKLQVMPMAVYAPLWIGWALACALLRWGWVRSSLAFVACAGLSVFAYPWPLHMPAVVPRIVLLGLAGGGPVLAAWMHRRGRGGGAKPVHGLAVLGASALLLGAVGAVQIVGRDAAVRPRPDRATLLGGTLSADGSLLALGAIGNYPTIGGRQGAETSSWLVDATTGALLQDGWRRCQYSFADSLQPGLVLGYAKPPRRGYWSVDPITGAELLVADGPHELQNLMLWSAKVQDGSLEIHPAGKGESMVLPWTGPAHGDPSNPAALQQAPELGVLYYREGDHLVRHDVLRDAKAVVVQLPGDLAERSWSWSLGPLGLAIRLTQPGEGTRFLDARDGHVIATVPERWWSAWTHGPRPFAIARPPRRDPEGVRLPWSPDSLWIDPDGAHPVELPHEGHLVSSASGRVFLVGDGVTELDPEGRALGTLNIRPSGN